VFFSFWPLFAALPAGLPAKPSVTVLGHPNPACLNYLAKPSNKAYGRDAQSLIIPRNADHSVSNA